MKGWEHHRLRMEAAHNTELYVLVGHAAILSSSHEGNHEYQGDAH